MRSRSAAGPNSPTAKSSPRWSPTGSPPRPRCTTWLAGRPPAAVHELLDTPAALLGGDPLGRAPEAFAPVAETVRGSAMLAAIGEFGADGARLHLDLTTLTVSGAYPGADLVGK